MHPRHLARILLFGVIALVFLGCREQRSREDLENRLVYGYDSDVHTFDPTRQRMMRETAIMAQVLEGLTRWNNDIQLEPCLATHWEKNDACTTWTFHLRPDVLFHNGDPFTSEAVRAHFVRTIDPATAATRRQLATHIALVDCPAPDRVVFHLSRPDCVFDQLLAATFAMIPNPRAVADLDKPFGQNPVGTGPYRFDSWTKDVAIRFSRFDEHWRAERHPIQFLEMRPVKENTTRYILLEQGALDMADVFFAQVKVARKSTDIKLQTVPQLACRYIGFNTKKPPFSDVRVRRAANHAVDREAMIRYQFFGVGLPASGPLPPALPAYNKELDGYPFDPDKARALLAEAGYPDGFEVDFWTMEAGEYRVAAEAVAEYLRQVGIRARIRIIDNAAYWRKFDEYIRPTGERYPTREGVFDMFVGGWVGGEAEFDYLKPLFSRDSFSNSTFYDNPVMEELLTSFSAEPDATKRTVMLKEMQRVVSEDAPWIFAYHSQVNVGHRKRVDGFRINPSGRYFFMDVRAPYMGGLY